MDILRGNDLYCKSVRTVPDFYRGTSMSSVVHKYDIIFQFMVWLILSKKRNLLMIKVFVPDSLS